MLMYSAAVVLFFTSGDPIPDWSRGSRDKLRAPLLAALFVFRLIGVWERDLVTVSSSLQIRIGTYPVLYME